MRVLPGDVIVTEGGHDVTGRVLKRIVRSPWTHCFVVLDAETLIESDFPAGVQVSTLSARLARLRTEQRSYVLLRYPGLHRYERQSLAKEARRYTGALYDVLQALGWACMGRGWPVSASRVTCATLVSDVYALSRIPLFAWMRCRYMSLAQWDQLRRGVVLPADVLMHSTLRVESAWAPRDRAAPRISRRRFFAPPRTLWPQ